MPFAVTAVLLLILGAFVSYLLGSVNSALIFTKLFKTRDVREVGSGNAGMTNAFRAGGKVVGILTLLGDLLKVFLAVWFGRLLLFPLIVSFAPDQQLAETIFHPMLAAYFCGFCCFIGHIYPIFFGFKGGKGVVTAVGTVLMVDWRLFILTFGTFLIILFITKIVSISSIIAAISYPIGTFTLYGFSHAPGSGFELGFWNLRLTETLITVLFAALIIFNHRSNIGRLLRGEEHKIGKRRKDG
jgi:glycerol-3-phosphate acyltransferase PlsY